MVARHARAARSATAARPASVAPPAIAQTDILAAEPFNHPTCDAHTGTVRVKGSAATHDLGRAAISKPKGNEMEYLIGALLGLAIGGFVTLSGFDRSRALYPTILIVVASYYCLFAVISGTDTALWYDTAIATLFAGAAIVGFRTSLWVIVAALVAHGTMDIVHHHLVSNDGVPVWWPGFCSTIDITIAACLALSIVFRSEAQKF